MAKLASDQASEFTIPEKIPLLLLQDTVVFPLMRVQLSVERGFSKAAVQQALLQDRLLFLMAQREDSRDDSAPNGPYQVGTICILVNSLPHEQVTEILVQGVIKAKVVGMWQEATYSAVSVEPFPDTKTTNDVEERALVRTVEKPFQGFVVEGG